MAKAKKRRGSNKAAFPLGLILIVFAVIGVIFFVSKNEEKHMTGLYIILFAMCFKIAESALRMIK